MRTKISYVKKCPDHKNSKGEIAEWCIFDHKTDKILSSHKSELAAKKHLQDMHAHKGNILYLKDISNITELLKNAAELYGEDILTEDSLLKAVEEDRLQQELENIGEKIKEEDSDYQFEFAEGEDPLENMSNEDILDLVNVLKKEEVQSVEEQTIEMTKNDVEALLNMGYTAEDLNKIFDINRRYIPLILKEQLRKTISIKINEKMPSDIKEYFKNKMESLLTTARTTKFITKEDILNFMEKYKDYNFTQEDIAKFFNVSLSTIKYLLTGDILKSQGLMTSGPTFEYYKYFDDSQQKEIINSMDKWSKRYSRGNDDIANVIRDNLMEWLLTRGTYLLDKLSDPTDSKEFLEFLTKRVFPRKADWLSRDYFKEESKKKRLVNESTTLP